MTLTVDVFLPRELCLGRAPFETLLATAHAETFLNFVLSSGPGLLSMG